METSAPQLRFPAARPVLRWLLNGAQRRPLERRGFQQRGSVETSAAASSFPARAPGATLATKWRTAAPSGARQLPRTETSAPPTFASARAPVLRWLPFGAHDCERRSIMWTSALPSSFGVPRVWYDAGYDLANRGAKSFERMETSAAPSSRARCYGSNHLEHAIVGAASECEPRCCPPRVGGRAPGAMQASICRTGAANPSR